MTNVFLDTNVMLDLLGKRDPFFDAIAKIATLAEDGKLSIVVSALSYSTASYVLEKTNTYENIISSLQKFKTISAISDLNENIVEMALNSDFKDFEDALQYFCALQSSCEIILTRNSKDFKSSIIPTMTADEFLEALQE